MNNILITSAGRRVSLVKEFQQTAAEFDKSIKVFASDMRSDMAAACFVADNAFVVPPLSNEGYIDTLLSICLANNIGIVIPTIDTELPLLAANKEYFASQGINLVVSSPEFITKCCDKRETIKMFEGYRIRTPRCVDPVHPEFPMFAKPYDGSMSKNLHVIKSADDLSESIINDPKLMFMEYIDMREYSEFTVDMYYGHDNHVKAIVPRERIEIRSGEISKGITRKNYLVDFLKERMEHLPGVVGTVCIQLFYRQSDNDVLGIEINPRFGGGYPLSYHAGANFPEMIMKEYVNNQTLDYRDDWHDNMMILRYDAEVIVESQA